MMTKKNLVKIVFFDDFPRNRWFLQNSDVIISFVSSSFYIKICTLLYYFDQYFFRYKPSKIHQNRVHTSLKKASKYLTHPLYGIIRTNACYRPVISNNSVTWLKLSQCQQTRVKWLMCAQHQYINTVTRI